MKTAKFLITGSPTASPFGFDTGKRTRGFTADQDEYEQDYSVREFLADDQFHLKEEKKKSTNFFSCCSADPAKEEINFSQNHHYAVDLKPIQRRRP